MPELVQASSSEDIRGLRTDSAKEWKGDLTLEQYLEREALMSAMVNTDGVLRTWMLQDAGTRVAACETLQTPAYFKYPGKPGSIGTQNIFANVCTPKEFRGKGYAAEMIASITNKLKGEGPLTLWSDVGNFYERVGFQFSNSDSLVALPPATLPPVPAVYKLDQPGAYALIDKHVQQVKDTVDALAQTNSKPFFAILPIKGLYAQLFFRATFTADKLALQQPTSYGATTANGWAVWSPSFVDKAVYILGLGGPLEDLVALFLAGLQEAKDYGFKLVVYEDSFADPKAFSDALTAAGIEHKIATRKQSLAMYNGDAHWACAGKFAWF